MYPYKVAVTFSNFNQNWNCWQISVKVSNLNSTNICVTGTKLFRVDRQSDEWTYAMKLSLLFSTSIANLPNMTEQTDTQTVTLVLEIMLYAVVTGSCLLLQEVET
jgi:hypothetical protein